MADNKLPVFSFAPSTTSSSSSTPLFGAAPTPSSTGGSMFGSTTSSNPFGSAGGSGAPQYAFGQPPTSTSGEEKKGLFGAAPTTGMFGAAQASGMFAPSPSGSGGNSPLSTGAGAGTGSSGTFSNFGFGSNSTPAKPAATAGSTSTTPAKPFGGFPSTTPAGAPPAASAFGASTGAGASSIFGSFGNQKPSAPPTTQSQPSLFGAAPAAPGKGISFGNPTPSASSAATPAAASKPSSVFSFPGAAQQTTAMSFSGITASTAPPSSTTGLFSNPDSLFSGSVKSTTTSQAAPSLFAGLGGKSNPPGPTAGSVPPTSSKSSTDITPQPLFSSFTSTATTTAPPPSSSAAATAPAAFSFMSTAQPASSTTTTAPPSTGISFVGTSSTAQPSTTSAPSQPTTSTFAPNITTTGPLPPPQSRLKNKTMDEILARWASDLTKYTKDFKTHAETVSQWDQKLVTNLAETAKIYGNTVKSEKQMQSVEMALSAVEKQQDELETWLTRYERDVDEMMAKNSSGQTEMGGPDQERERTYKLAERLGERLDEMDRDLVGMIEEVNSVTAGMSRNGGRDEPITQIVKILNSHLTQLQEIDQGTAALQAKVTTAQKAATQLGYSNGTSNGDGRAAVEDFYRSYMGRR